MTTAHGGSQKMTRRGWIGATAASSALLAGARTAPAADETGNDGPFILGLNTSTVHGQKLGIVREAELAAKAGFTGLEPWVRELDEYVKGGGKLDELGRRFRDLGLRIESVIGFFDWIVDDDARRAKALEEARRNFEMVRAIGGVRLAAPPVGATDRTDLDLNRAAERYRALLELGDRFGVVPQVEVWGFSKTLRTLGEAAHVAIAADHPKACVLADVYHLYKGGSGFNGLRLLGKDAMHVMHVNDYPASPSRDRINDSDRVYPGDGVAPLRSILRDLRAIGFRGMLSVELFNKAYYELDAATVLRTAFEKLQAAVKASEAG